MTLDYMNTGQGISSYEPLMWRISNRYPCKNKHHLINLWFGFCNEWRKTKGLWWV